jgi:Cellulose biosynthesis protein BcsS
MFAVPLASFSQPALAVETGGSGEPKPPPRFEVYSGLGYDARGANLYSDAVWSISGPVTEPGFRLRASLFTSVYGSTDSGVFSTGFQPADMGSVGDLMVGYQLNRGDLWLKLYAGAAYQSQMRLFWDVGQSTQDQGWGAKAAIEAWWRVSSRLWASADVSWLELNKETSIYSRLGYEVLRLDAGFIFSIGTEASADFGDASHFELGKHLDDYDSCLRGGALLNLRYGWHDLTLTGGLAQSSEDAKWLPYATLSYGRKF